MSAIGSRLGERARGEPGVLDALRATPDLAAFQAFLREACQGLVAPALVEQLLLLPTEADWTQWRSRILLQAKMVREGKSAAPGHEAGKGVGRP